MANLTPEDLEQLRERVVQALTQDLDASSGSDRLAAAIVEAASQVTAQMLWEYHRLLQEKSKT